MSTGYNSTELRPATVTLLARLIAPLLDTGVITAREYTTITTELRAIAKGKPAATVSPSLISVQTAAEILDVSPSQIRQMLREGTLPFAKHRIGTNVKFLKKDVLEYAEFGSLEQEVKKNETA